MNSRSYEINIAGNSDKETQAGSHPDIIACLPENTTLTILKAAVFGPEELHEQFSAERIHNFIRLPSIRYNLLGYETCPSKALNLSHCDNICFLVL